MSVKENILRIRAKLPPQVKLVAAVKNAPLEKIFEALEAGITDIGENRVQEAAQRYRIIKDKYPQVIIHLIGHLQRNKVGQALDIFDIMQSVDSARLIEEINKRAKRPVPILIEVNTSGETSKFGIEPDRALELARFASSFEKIKVRGLMTMGLLAGHPEAARPGFARLRRLRDEISRLNLPGVEMQSLSMGMTDDFEVAVEEGANMVRIGRAIFKEGEYKW
jgi:pyridoxal phosphate enzyme (YggS family)